jgi:hypothetical protein
VAAANENGSVVLAIVTHRTPLRFGSSADIVCPDDQTVNSNACCGPQQACFVF